MSYILDALTKLDQERQRARSPDLYTPVAMSSPAPQHHSRWLYVLGGAGSALILTVLWFQFSHEPRTVQPPRAQMPPSPAKAEVLAQEAPRPDGEKALTNAEAALPSMPAALLPANAVLSSRDPVAEKPLHSDRVRKPMEANGTRESASNVSRTRASAPVSRAASSNASPPKVAAPGAPRGISDVNELPPPIQREMPKISVSGYAHSSDPNARVAVINNRMLAEGDEVRAGVKVEQILQDGVILSYKGYRFRGAAP